MKPFWEYKRAQQPSEVTIAQIEAHLAERAIFNKETVEHLYSGGVLNPEKKIEALRQEILDKGGHLFYLGHPTKHQQTEERIYIWDDSGIAVDFTPKSKSLSLIIKTTNPEIMAFGKRLALAYVTSPVTRGEVYVVGSDNGRPKLIELGVAGEDFIPENYRAEIVEDYDHVISDLNSKTPCGFLTLLNGPPGTGKTHMIRAVLNSVKKATFILVPSNMISSLGSPDFLTLLTYHQSKSKPMILIIEDADEAIINRKEGSRSALTALLNFTDGIFGAMLNMRVICTTNITIDDLDDATKREGRLCRHIEIGLLDTLQANTIFERLTGRKGDLKKKFYTLGSIYSLADGNKSRTVTQSKRTDNSVGFHLPTAAEALDAMAGSEEVEKITGSSGVEYVLGPDGHMIPIADKSNGFYDDESESGPLRRAQPKPLTGSSIGVMEDDDSDLIDEDPDEDDDGPDFISEESTPELPAPDEDDDE